MDKTHASLQHIATELGRLERHLRALQAATADALLRVPAGHRPSATNLVHYVALRQNDLRALQEQLAELGLSSLGRSEGCVLRSLLAVAIRTEEALASLRPDTERKALPRLRHEHALALSGEAAARHLHEHTQAVFGPRPADRHIYVMATAPSVREADQAWMVALLRAGMNVLRINCAHEGQDEWRSMIEVLDKARTETGLSCRVVMDLAGPKLRTGSIRDERHIASWKPPRDELGRPTHPAEVVIRRASGAPTCAHVPTLSVSERDFAMLREADELRFHDARNKLRLLLIARVEGEQLVAYSQQRAYVLDRVEARVYRNGHRKHELTLEVVAMNEPAIEVRSGEALLLSARARVSTLPTRARDGQLQSPGVVSCPLREAFACLAVGQRVLFDDGKISTRVERVLVPGEEFELRVERTHKARSKLRAEKGINLPDTELTIPGFTDEDRSALAFAARHADAVSLSFARDPRDIHALHVELEALGRSDLGLILKIETRTGFENLPRLLLEGLHKPPLAVMVARGDLAVEVGFERLAELQEEVLWLCEAAHVPTIWATQVLDSLARTGVPTRAEVTDAAHGVAAECVMLNKGPHVAEAVSVLCDILRRMEGHRYKKRSLFRRLQVSTFEPDCEK